MRHIAPALLVCLLLIGCGKGGPAKGTVSGTLTYKKQPLNGAALHLDPMAEGGSKTVIPVDQQGNFRATGIVAGDYRVKVEGSLGSKPPPSIAKMTEEQKQKMADKIKAMESPPTIPFPVRYKEFETSHLTVTVERGSTTLNLDLTD
jgi:hypothetical protein